jgi:hypothetical protein
VPTERPTWTTPGGGDRREAMPGLLSLPRRVWRRLPPAGRVLLVLLPFAVVGLALALAPGIDESKDQRAQAEEQRLERLRNARVEQIREQQQPRLRAAPAPPPGDIAARERLVATASAAVLADARRRVASGELDGPVRRVACEPFPRTVSGRGADQDPDRRYGVYSCLAVTTAFGANTTGEVESYSQSEAGLIGHPYRVRMDFDTGRFAFCKISGRAGEGSIGAQPVVTVPRVCGGL